MRIFDQRLRAAVLFLVFTSLIYFSYSKINTQKDILSYNRKEWRHWIDEDKNCLHTRDEVLKSRSLIQPVMNTTGCRVVKGKWSDFYFNETLEDPKKIDIDHVVPLKHANDTGGKHWDRDQKKRFANDLENLVITNRRYNRQKGHQTIATWLPSSQKYACEYVKRWFLIKEKYKLKISPQELKTRSLLTCP